MTASVSTGRPEACAALILACVSADLGLLLPEAPLRAIRSVNSGVTWRFAQRLARCSADLGLPVSAALIFARCSGLAGGRAGSASRYSHSALTGAAATCGHDWPFLIRETVFAEIPNASPTSLHRAPAARSPLTCATWASVTLAFGLPSPHECRASFARVAGDGDLPLLACPLRGSGRASLA